MHSKLAKIFCQCALTFFSEVECEATCGITRGGDSNFANYTTLVDLKLPVLGSGCQFVENDYLCRKSSDACEVGQP